MGKRNTRILLQGILMTTVIILLFVGVILAYYAMLRTETRQRIIEDRRISAVTTAQQIDRYLSTGIDAMRLACFTLDNMIRDGRSQEEIKTFLDNQSRAISNITAERSPGLYGYINGEYLDGTGWIPEEDYEPTERPWYIDARANIGRVAVVDPYVDLETNSVMIALAKTLCDAKSVAAMDFSVEYLQRITEELAAESESDMEIVLDRKYRVIAHSDRGEVGKSYFTENDTFGNALVGMLRSSVESFFFLHFGSKEYIVYSVSVANDWLCLSVFDATGVFQQMQKTLLFTVIAVCLVALVLIFVMIRFNRKSIMAQQLLENLTQAKSDIMEKDGQIGRIRQVAFRDALTGVGSKAGFDQYSQDISQELRMGKTSLAVVMMDVNNLKYVNDTFGHEAGDTYLKGCCKIICDMYKHSSVFRIGGDEFVAILHGPDYEDRGLLALRLEEKFSRTYAQEDKPPWERYSASVGMADSESSDLALDPVLKRADKAMYAAKQAFKAKHGGYR